MKRFFGMLLLCTAMVFAFSACSDDDDSKGVELTKEQVVGTWDVVWAKEGGESVDVPKGQIVAQFNSDYTYEMNLMGEHYVGEYSIKGNKVTGVTPDPIKEYFVFKSIKGNTAEIDYSNSEKDKLKFKAVKR